MWESWETSLKLGGFMDSYLNWRGNALILFLASEGITAVSQSKEGW